MTPDYITKLQDQLSTSWSIDPDADWVKKHNAQARQVLETFEKNRPIRVPIRHQDGAHIHGFYADEIDLDYRQYAASPEVMIRVQLEAARRRRELPIYDSTEIGQLPHSWGLSVDLHPVVPFGWVGCEVVFRRNSVPAHVPVRLSREECRDMPMPDPRTGGILKQVRELLDGMRRYEDRLEFLSRPVGPVSYSVGHHGLFSVALNIRGEDIMLDMYEDPEFVHRFLRKIAAWWEELNVVWHGDQARKWPLDFSDHGIEMLSPQQYETFIVPVIKEYNSQRGLEICRHLHHCGGGTHLFGLMVKHFGMDGISALTYPLVDVAKVKRQLGDGVGLTVCIADQILHSGNAEWIRQTVKDFMQSGVKDTGKIQLMVGDMPRGIPLSSYEVLYESIKEFGSY